jgi:hypothetical protein
MEERRREGRGSMDHFEFGGAMGRTLIDDFGDTLVASVESTGAIQDVLERMATEAEDQDRQGLTRELHPDDM